MDFLNAKGWLTRNERYALKQFAERVPDGGLIVNIGVEYGASLVCLRAGAPTAQIIGIDIDNSKCVAHVGAELITGDSAKVYQTWDRSIDLLFIDGDHSYDGVLADTQYCRWLKPKSVVVFHDCYALDGTKSIHPVCPEVNEAVWAWANTLPSTTDYKQIPAPDSMRGFVKRP